MKHTRPEWGDMHPTRLLERLAPPQLHDVLARGYALHESVDRRRTLEIAALRVSTLRDSAYEWVAHTKHLRGGRLLTEEEIAQVAGGKACLTGSDAAPVQAIDDQQSTLFDDAIAESLDHD